MFLTTTAVVNGKPITDVFPVTHGKRADGVPTYHVRYEDLPGYVDLGLTVGLLDFVGTDPLMDPLPSVRHDGVLIALESDFADTEPVALAA